MGDGGGANCRLNLVCSLRNTVPQSEATATLEVPEAGLVGQSCDHRNSAADQESDNRFDFLLSHFPTSVSTSVRLSGQTFGTYHLKRPSLPLTQEPRMPSEAVQGKDFPVLMGLLTELVKKVSERCLHV